MQFNTVLFSPKRIVDRLQVEAGVEQSSFMTDVTRLKVLVVDDERELADLAVELLQMHDVDVRVAYSGEEALRILEEDREVNAVFSDVMMPDMTGLTLAQRVTTLHPDVHIVLTSGFVFPAARPESRPPYSLVPKPYRIETVLRSLRNRFTLQ